MQLAVTLHLFNDVAWEYTLNRSMNFFHATIIVFDYKSLLSSKFIVIWCFVTFICLCKYVIIWYWCNLISCLNFPFEVISHATKTVSGYIAGSGQSDVATCTIKYDERLILPFLPSAMHKWLCISARFFSAYFILARFLERFLDSRRTLPLSIMFLPTSFELDTFRSYFMSDHRPLSDEYLQVENDPVTLARTKAILEVFHLI